TNLRAQLEAVEDGLAPPDAGALASLREEVLLLARLVNDLQELALAEAGQLPLHRAAVPAGEAIAAALAAVAPIARARGVRLEADVAADAPALDADPARLGQVLRNLLDNALRHVRDAGRIVVRARPDAAGVAVAVEDDGEGIAPEHLPHVFDRFYRADAARARARGGAGLGLAIVRQLVEAHGGRVRVENRPGGGARFTLVLPAWRS
ncbi:MAG TPA: ATP-binding protein, partial [Candidatus Eisenbacteria bacterium]|nr:ATP-binding protein [Candidatus Eisenbacteria bacterium]